MADKLTESIDDGDLCSADDRLTRSSDGVVKRRHRSPEFRGVRWLTLLGNIRPQTNTRESPIWRTRGSGETHNNLELNHALLLHLRRRANPSWQSSRFASSSCPRRAGWRKNAPRSTWRIHCVSALETDEATSRVVIEFSASGDHVFTTRGLSEDSC